ncbi:phospholipase [Roseococcus sp. SYP-B2431]|uniref:alpha/beta hydrolase n=1 Tax=Roseococcus sp. SYP-B2431 TaxID=2496640 RepID=UPI00103AB58A|nr:phospholipase [Roseococcus sp. SYP-B2431]TCH99061.1 phospholipase [Roseococcus sp. SYP-B2431]
MTLSFSEEEQAGWLAGRLSARPAPPVAPPLPPGPGRPLGAGEDRPVLHVPADLPGGGIPLIVMLHGATSNPTRALGRLGEEPDRRKCLVLATKSRGSSWDILEGGYGFDVAMLDYALTATFRRFPIDPRRIAIAGFSDGASYALSLGVANGDLFTHAMGFSPGFVVPGPRRGRPSLFVSHGREDAILPIDRCGRPVAARLREEGYAVRYLEFEGGHVLPPEMVAAAMDDFEANAQDSGGA